MRIRVDVALSIAAIAAYLCNRYFISFDAFLPYEFAHYHFGDLCGGFLFPAYFNLLTYSVKRTEAVDGYAKGLLLATVCSFAWEIVTPALSEKSTGDPVDAAMYFFGTMAYIWCRKRYMSIGNSKHHFKTQGDSHENKTPHDNGGSNRP